MRSLNQILFRAALALCALAPAGVAAQGVGVGAGAGVGPGTYVAIPETFPELDARAIVVREGPREIIVLRADEATPEALQTALEVLRESREEHPAPELGLMIPITGFVRFGPLTVDQRVRLERALDALRRRPVADLGRLGPGRWVRWEPLPR